MSADVNLNEKDNMDDNSINNELDSNAPVGEDPLEYLGSKYYRR